MLTVFKKLKQKLFGLDNSSKDLAKSRLHFVLVQDRTGLTNEEMAGFKEEMVKVIEKDGFDISYHRDVETTTLLINSPVIVRRIVPVNNDSKVKGAALEASNSV